MEQLVNPVELQIEKPGVHEAGALDRKPHLVHRRPTLHILMD
jgi:hypothetical protein